MDCVEIVLVCCLFASATQASPPTILSVHEWQGKYTPKARDEAVKEWGNDISTSTIATVGNATVNQLIYGWAIFRIHVRPAYFPFPCEITKSVCLYGSGGCNNTTIRMLFQDSGVYNDDKSFNSSYIYKSEGTFPTTSHVYMDNCGGSQYGSHGNGTVTVTAPKKKNKNG